VEQTSVVPVGRLAAGLARGAAEERVDAIARSIPPEHPRVDVRGARLDGLLWRSDLRSVLDVGMAVMVTAAGLLLLIACVNVAGMMLARSFERRREIAVRLAIGAGPGRLVRQMLAESVLLAMIGGAAGVMVAIAGTAALSRISVPVEFTVTLDLVPDPVVLLATFAIAGAAGILFGMGPALHSASTDLTTSLKGGAQSRGAGRRRSAFVVGQLALTTLLLVVAGLFVRSFTSVANVPLGFDPEGMLVAEIALESHGYAEEEGRAFYDRLLERVRALPAVESAGLGRSVLLGGSNSSHDGRAADGDPDAGSTSIAFNIVDPDYFSAGRFELVEGRFFTDADDEAATRVAIVNQTTAERLWPGRTALGRRFRTAGIEREVVGVVRNGVYVFQSEGEQAFTFYPYAQAGGLHMSLHVRSGGSLGALAAEIRGIVRDLDPNVAVGDLRTMDEVVSANRFGHAFIARFTMVIAAIGLLLAAIGVYGLLAVQVAQRSREFGVRRALGAKIPDVLLLVIRRGVMAAAIGCALGLAAALGAGRILASLLYRVSPFDPLTFVLVPAVLVGAALLASAVPARRAARISPTDALREE
jgi:predicted permease